jgi:4-hydroxybenzoate polyprenyltransferase
MMIESNTPHGKTAVLTGIIQILRPRQWIKNMFVLAPLIFAGAFMNAALIKQALMAAVLFCIASSSVYIVNDLQDIENDRKHPSKMKKRPLASGAITKTQACIVLGALYGLLVAGYMISGAVTLVIVSYIALNIAYTFALKQQPIFDIFTIAIGFVLRVYAGAMAISVPLSSWMFITTLCLALFLAAVKRRQEIKQTGTQGREVLAKYSVALLDRYAEISATGALLFYSLFVMTAHPHLILTIPFVLFGLFRYWFLVESLNEGESPTDVLLADGQLLVTVILWAAMCAWGIWPA